MTKLLESDRLIYMVVVVVAATLLTNSHKDNQNDRQIDRERYFPKVIYWKFGLFCCLSLLLLLLLLSALQYN